MAGPRAPRKPINPPYWELDDRYLNVDQSNFPGDLTADLAFRRGNILGTVSQSGGTPTGALIERGSNANGEYVRLADGTQFCWITGIVMTVGGTTSLTHAAVTFPAAFSAAPMSFPSPTGVSGTAIRNQGLWIPTSVSGAGLTPRFLGAGEWTNGADTLTISLFVTGRWF